MKNRVIQVMAVVILGFCAWGFGSKFIELIRLVSSEGQDTTEGIYAVAPMANYLLASVGFLCMLGWAATQGMFTDIEKPKQVMLNTEEQLDAGTTDEEYANSVMK
ncbi:MAG: hypothetical protein RH917_12000 [Lacipirellulaceae bacterium]